jgi:phage shock protein A
MLKDLQKLFRDTWDAFRTELGRREPEDEVAELLGMMRRELVEARATLPLLEDSIKKIEGELSREQQSLADCERRASLAVRIGDEDTVRVATEFATRHRERLEVLERKRAAALAERDLRVREVQQMTERYKEADANRFVLLAELRRQKAAGTLRDTVQGGAFADFARMEEAVNESVAYAEALEELDDAGRAAPGGGESSVRRVDQRLEELKRKMGKG